MHGAFQLHRCTNRCTMAVWCWTTWRLRSTSSAGPRWPPWPTARPSSACTGCLARLEAATTRATAAFDAGGEWASDGARTAAAWVAARCQLPSSSARRRVRLGRALRHLPATEATWLAGEVGEAQVAALARARTPATEEAMARDEEMLVGEAERLRHTCASSPSPGCWPTGASTPTPTGWRPTPAASATPGACTSRRASGGRGSSTGCWTPSPGRWSTTPCVASNRNSSTPTGPRPGSAWAMPPAWPTWGQRRPAPG
jgi:hypothetical protein